MKLVKFIDRFLLSAKEMDKLPFTVASPGQAFPWLNEEKRFCDTSSIYNCGRESKSPGISPVSRLLATFNTKRLLFIFERFGKRT